MKNIEAKVRGRRGEESTSVPPDDSKSCQQYRQWVEELSKNAVADADRYLITFAEHLREYHIALTINKSTTMKNAKKSLEKYFESLDREKFLPIDKSLERLFQCAMEILDKNVAEHGEPENPFLMKLKELLLQHYKGDPGITGESDQERPSEEDDNFAEHAPDNKTSDKSSGEHKDWIGPKGILFTRTRESTSALEDWIKEDEQLRAVLRPEALVGSGDGNSKFNRW